MSWDNLVDTMLNLGVFVFIGFLLWLYFKPMSEENEDDADR